MSRQETDQDQIEKFVVKY